MASGFNRFSFVPAASPALEANFQGAESFEGDFDSVARRYVARLFAAAPNDSVRAARETLVESASQPAAQTSEGDPTLILKRMQEERLSNTVVVKYQQAVRDVPVYGAVLAVEMTPAKTLVSVSGQVSIPRNVNPIAALSPSAAHTIVKRIAGFAPSASVSGLDAPHLLYRFDSLANIWRLCYLFKRVRIMGVPASLENSPDWDDFFSFYNLFIDAMTGEEVARVPLRSLVAVSGNDAGGTLRTVEGKAFNGGFVLIDQQRNIRTHSLGFNDVNCGSLNLPGSAISSATAAFAKPAAIAAHYNAGRVYDFYKNVLQRNSIDGNGMAIISTVDCLDYAFDYNNQTCLVDATPPAGNIWKNAAWVGTQMIYGQALWTDGSLRSYAESLDVVGHELTHGVTERSAELEYQTESGALNESYSDIMGIAIANLAKPITAWDWRLGVQINGNAPLRRFDNPSDPTLARPQPSHMEAFRRIPFGGQPNQSNDHGHVHGNSGIHNKAAYNLFTAPGNVFTPVQVISLFYSTLTVSLSAQSGFADSKQGMLDRCSVLFAGAADLNQKSATVKKAFDDVGI